MATQTSAQHGYIELLLKTIVHSHIYIYIDIERTTFVYIYIYNNQKATLLSHNLLILEDICLGCAIPLGHHLDVADPARDPCPPPQTQW